MFGQLLSSSSMSSSGNMSSTASAPAPRGSVVVPVCPPAVKELGIAITVDGEREREREREKEGFGEGEINNMDMDQQASLSQDMQVWNTLESDLMTAQTMDSLKIAIVNMYSKVLDNPRLRESVGIKAVIMAGKQKREQSTDLWDDSVANAYGALLRLMTIREEPNPELEPLAETPKPRQEDTKAAVVEGVTGSGVGRAASGANEASSVRVMRMKPRSLFLTMWFLCTVLFAALITLVIFGSKSVTTAFPYIIASALVIFSVLFVPCYMQQIIKSPIDTSKLFVMSTKIVILKMFRNAAYTLIFFCFAGAPGATSVSSYTYTVTGMTAVLYLVLCYIFWTRMSDLIEANNTLDTARVAEIFMEETGYQVIIDGHEVASEFEHDV